MLLDTTLSSSVFVLNMSARFTRTLLNGGLEGGARGGKKGAQDGAGKRGRKGRGTRGERFNRCGSGLGKGKVQWWVKEGMEGG